MQAKKLSHKTIQQSIGSYVYVLSNFLVSYVARKHVAIVEAARVGSVGLPITHAQPAELVAARTRKVVATPHCLRRGRGLSRVRQNERDEEANVKTSEH